MRGAQLSTLRAHLTEEWIGFVEAQGFKFLQIRPRKQCQKDVVTPRDSLEFP